MSAEPNGKAPGQLERAVERAAEFVGGVRGLLAAAFALLVGGGVFALAAAQVPTKNEVNVTVESAIAKHAAETHPDVAHHFDATDRHLDMLDREQAVEAVHREWIRESLRRIMDKQGVIAPPGPELPTIRPAPPQR